MKNLKPLTLIFLILIAVGILLRGPVYRSLVFYKSIGQRKSYSLTSNKLANYINTSTETLNALKIEQIIKISLSITSKQLNFTAEKNDIDPNKLIVSKKAHCVGYSAFFATTCNYLLKRHKLSSNWVAKPQVGQLYLWGINIHQFFNSPFFKDHDFVIIENKTTDRIIAVDPTVNDYLRIDGVSYIK